MTRSFVECNDPSYDPWTRRERVGAPMDRTVKTGTNFEPLRTSMAADRAERWPRGYACVSYGSTWIQKDMGRTLSSRDRRGILIYPLTSQSHLCVNPDFPTLENVMDPPGLSLR